MIHETIKIRNASLMVGDVLGCLRTLPSDSVQCCVTSPPYWGLRSYGTEPQIWGGDPACEHQWTERTIPDLTGGTKSISGNGKSTPHAVGRVCGACGAWRGELGSEPTSGMFVEHLVEIFREVRRVLRPDGTAWVNLGDSYNAAGREGHGTRFGYKQGTNRASANGEDECRSSDFTLKPKDLCGVPWRFVLAAQADGWYWRKVISWVKKSPMPESVMDRPTSSWEPIFMLTKSERYFYDKMGYREPATNRAPGNLSPGKAAETAGGSGFANRMAHYRCSQLEPMPDRNMRDSWILSAEPTRDAHFATFPSEIPLRCISVSTSEKGCCASCGAPWERVTERIQLHRERPNELTKRSGEEGTGNHCANGVAGVSVETRGWEPTCDCNAEIAPCVVLDPFAGSGTTLKVAEQLGRRSIGIELNPKYAHEIAVPKIRLALTDRSVKPLKPLDGQKELFAFAEPAA